MVVELLAEDLNLEPSGSRLKFKPRQYQTMFFVESAAHIGGSLATGTGRIRQSS